MALLHALKVEKGFKIGKYYKLSPQVQYTVDRHYCQYAKTVRLRVLNCTRTSS